MSDQKPGEKKKVNSIDDIDEDMPTALQSTTIQPARKGATSLAQIILSVTNKMKGLELPPPNPDLFIADLPKEISALDLDVIKLTAQFVARNGHQFQVGLMNREHKNPQFEFLKQNHPWNPFFLILVESYARCLLPPKNYVTKLKEQYSDKQNLLEDIIKKFENDKQQKLKKQLEEQKELEQQFNTQINWHEFVIVETLDFFEDEIPIHPPTTTKETRETTPTVDEMETDMEVEDEHHPKPNSQIELKVRKDYTRPAVNPLKRGPIQYQVCPKCGQQVPIEEMQEHMRQELLNQNVQTKSDLKPSIAPDSDISKNLMKFAKRRTDIFGEEETDIGKTIGQESHAPKSEESVWDGQTTIVRAPVPFKPPGTLSIDPVTGLPIVAPPPTVLPIGSNLPIPPTNPINLTPSVPPVAPNVGLMGMPPAPNPMIRTLIPGYSPGMMGMQHPTMSPTLAEPPPKKQKLNDEESKLIPEEEFLQTHGSGPITVKVQIPVDEKIENLKGQTLSFDVELKLSVNDLKEKIKGAIGFAANKQKLKIEPLGVLKDTNTLAYYNFRDGTVLHLEKKERGGKSKKK